MKKHCEKIFILGERRKENSEYKVPQHTGEDTDRGAADDVADEVYAGEHTDDSDSGRDDQHDGSDLYGAAGYACETPGGHFRERIYPGEEGR